jgi:hypothetical protein
MRSALIIFSATILLTIATSENCNAQLFRGNSRSQASTAAARNIAPPVWVKAPGLEGYHVPQDLNAPSVFPTKDYYTPRRPKLARIIDGPMTHKHRNPAEVDSRYIGGFHQSHFNNIGIPSGDIGIRGNAYNWRTW